MPDMSLSGKNRVKLLMVIRKTAVIRSYGGDKHKANYLTLTLRRRVRRMLYDSAIISSYVKYTPKNLQIVQIQ